VGGPVGEGGDDGVEFVAEGGELVGEAPGALLIGRRREDPGSFEAAQPIGEHVRGQLGQRRLDVAEALRARLEGLDDQQGPAVTHDVEGGGQRASGVSGQGSIVHWEQSDAVSCRLQATSHEERAMAVVEQLEQAVTAVAERAGPAVVGIGHGRGPGSGVVVAEGVVVTNAHNVRHRDVAVTFSDGREATATLAGVDVDGDLAVLQVDTGDVTPVAWAESGHGPRAGQVVFALANPAGRGVATTFGVVTAAGRAFRGPRGRRITGSVEHSAPLPRGASGGPIVDGDGRLLGINTNRLGDGFYLALPADSALRERVEALTRGESPVRLRLGVAVAPAPAARRMRSAVGLPERDGLLVRGVEDGSPAARAGIKTGDLLVRAAGRELRVADDLHEALDGFGEDTPLLVDVVRGVDELEVSVAFGADATSAAGEV
jgi:serine protease Do